MHQRGPIPVPDLVSQPFWDACAEHRLLLQYCSDCNAPRYPPRSHCSACGSPESHWVHVKGRGQLYSWAVVHHPVHPFVRDAVPYVLVMVELDEGVRMASQLLVDSDASLVEGLPVEVTFAEIASGTWVPYFRAASDVPRRGHQPVVSRS